jgi:hypothetical protein
MTARSAAFVTTFVLGISALAVAAHAAPAAAPRVTVFGDSAATAMAYDPDAKKVLARGIDLRLEVAACRRVGETSCPYDGVRPPNVIDRATELGRELGPVVVVIVGYNDYESTYAEKIEAALSAFRRAGVGRVLWATLRAERQSYLSMNEAIVAAARKHPEMAVLDWNAAARARPEWLQPDGIHLTPAGANGMAALINDTLVQLGIAPKPVAASPSRRLLTIASRALPGGQRGRVYSARLRATGGTAPYRWARIGGTFAAGLHLTADGRIAGLPSRSGKFKLRLRVVDRTGAARTRNFSLRIA